MTTITDEMKRDAALRWCNYERPGGCNEACGTCVYRAGQILQAALQSTLAADLAATPSASRHGEPWNAAIDAAGNCVAIFQSKGVQPILDELMTLKSHPSANADAGGAKFDFDVFERATELMAMWLARFRDEANEEPNENDKLTAGHLAGALAANNLLVGKLSITQPPDGWVMVPREVQDFDVLFVAGRLRGLRVFRGECGQIEQEAVKKVLCEWLSQKAPAPKRE